MTKQYIFQPAEPVAIPVKGTTQLFPIHRIFCVGRNYMAHAKEMGTTVDKTQQEPFYFLKHPSSYVPNGSEMPYPTRTDNLHYEMEFVVAIGKSGANISQQDAVNHIFGYGCGLDMTRRDLQAKAKDNRHPWDIAKDFENSAILSEIIAIAQSGEITEGIIELEVNGEVRQSSDLNNMIWNVNEIIEHLSTLYTLQPGDIIMTGTPEGVGAVQPDDQIIGFVKGVGELLVKIIK
ncbi:fumarylacetoacetate hydrolase family protein [Wohlfahrtiimonas populi]|uniref:fumarylacetoacetate hydrolase family protein n=1 Tax=Wohlfahrtiimonas populi TaxID=1940240 RepID=UPI00098D5381|nr:fumarylacetoacetate hydrolase family protein [Wohlfahrtiimonas populi]